MDANSIQSALLELQTELQRQRKELQHFRTELQHQNKELLLSLESRPAQRPSHSLPDPEKFVAKNYLYETWLPSITAKLCVDGESIGDSKAQFYYLFSRLESHVQAEVLEQVNEAEKSQSWEYSTILQQLTSIYGSLSTPRGAFVKLFTLRQGTDSLATYRAKFERCLYEAQVRDWPDGRKILQYERGLNSETCDKMYQVFQHEPIPQSYVGFASFVETLEELSLSTYDLPYPKITSSRRTPAMNGASNGVADGGGSSDDTPPDSGAEED